jgi:polyhydroxybutyrate depolymerase
MKVDRSEPRFSIGCLSFLAACVCALALAPQVSAQETQEKVQVNDVTRNFALHLPAGYNADHHYPVVILFHGSNQDADDLERITHFNQLADKEGIITIFPRALGQWNFGVHAETQSQAPQRYGRRRGFGYPGGGGGGGYPGGGGGGYPGGGGGGQNPGETRNRPEPADDVAFVGEILDQLALKYSLDVHRVYATGLGDGGFMAERLGCAMADRIAAIGAVGASFPKTMICLPSRPISVLLIEGTADPLVPYNGGTFKERRFPVLSAEKSAEAWAKFDRCGEKPAQGKIAPVDKGGKETKTFAFSGCQGNAEVELYAVKDGGNTWPGGEVFTTESEVARPATPSMRATRCGISFPRRSFRIPLIAANRLTFEHGRNGWQLSPPLTTL